MIKQAKPIIFGTIIIVVGFHLSMTALHGLTVFWIDSLQSSGFVGTAEDQVQYINDRMWYSYPRLLFYVCLATTWFAGGLLAARKTGSNRVATAFICGIVAGVYFYINWWALIVLVFISMLGGIFAIPKPYK